MKKVMKLISLPVAALLLIGLFAGCSPAGTEDFYDPGSAADEYEEGVIMDLAAEMVPLTTSPASFILEMPQASGSVVKKNAKAEIDYSNPSDGYVMVRFLQKTTKQLRVLVTGPSNERYTYTLKQNGDWEVFPLSDGNGSYTIGVYEQIEDTKYATANSVTINVTLKDEFAPFLRPNQYVNFTKESEVVKKAAELVKGVNGLKPQVAAIYEFIIKNFTYDREKAQTVKSGYLPEVDKILAAKKGICFDYAAVMAAMLRSQGIPTRLVVGYAGTQYHAWIDVYSPEEGWINSIILFNGKEWNLMDPTFASSANQSTEVMNFIGDGSNYKQKFLY